MRRALILCLSALPMLAACHKSTAGDAVREAYDNKADRIDAAGAKQPTKTARELYHDEADAYREEGKDREKGLEGRAPSKGPDPAVTQPQQPQQPQ